MTRSKNALLQHFLTVRQFCQQFQVGKTRTYALIKAGAIDAVKNGSRTLITADSAHRWATSLPRLKSGNE